MNAKITPIYRLINLDSGTEITGLISPYLANLSLTESNDNKNDTLTIKVAGQGASKFPASGTNIELLIGYRESELVSFGAYKVDTKTLSGMPLSVSIKAGATDFSAPYKAQKSRNWDMVFLTDVLAYVAKVNGLELSVDDAFSDIFIEYLAQQQESDMQLIARLAKEHSAEGTIKSGKLAFKVKSKSTKTRDISPSDLTSFTINWFDKPKFDCATANWRDTNSNVAHKEIYDGKDFIGAETGNASQVKAVFTSQFLARKAAKSNLKNLNAQTLKATLGMVGDPTITSKQGLVLKGFMDEMDGTTLYITQTTHTISTSGYHTSIECSNEDED